MDKIKLSHGGGGIDSRNLIDSIVAILGNPILNSLEDSAIFEFPHEKLAFTTDGFVVKPIFFPGGDIGKLAVCGTINDLSVMGARPLALSLSLIVEEGFPKTDLEQILYSIKETAGDVPIVTGDTKVVERGSADGIFITTTGVGAQLQGAKPSASRIEPGDFFIISGSIGRHGAAIMAKREELGFSSELISDVANLSSMLIPLFEKFGVDIKTCRDVTRGGLAAIISEFAHSSDVGVEIHEEKIPVDSDVSGICAALGIDPLTLACEGKSAARG
ncbi:MAG: hydrogenase expression/formation protein HypE [Caldisericia bacterium]